MISVSRTCSKQAASSLIDRRLEKFSASSIGCLEAQLSSLSLQQAAGGVLAPFLYLQRVKYFDGRLFYLSIQYCRNPIARGRTSVLFCSSAVDCTQTFLFPELPRTASRVFSSLSQPLLLVLVSPKQSERCSLDKQLLESTRSPDCRSLEQLQFDDYVPY